MAAPLRLCTLQDVPHHAPELVAALWSEWSDDYVCLTRYKTQEALLRFYATAATTAGGSVPLCYVAVDCETGAFMGTALADVEDMGVRPHLSPWLSSVYVLPQHRGRGVASALVAHVVERHPLLHLWTFNDRLASFYERFGFVRLGTETSVNQHDDVVVMVRRSH